MALIIAADIGGTNCRIAIFQEKMQGLTLKKAVTVPTQKLTDTQSLLDTIEKELEVPIYGVDALVAALAGPVSDNRGKLTNAEFDLNFPALGLLPPNYCVINDFEAQAYATLESANIGAKKLYGQPSAKFDRLAIIGAGTGLGYASLAYMEGFDGEDKWQVLPSENGHAAFPFINAAEQEFHTFLQKHLHISYASGDDVLSGRGLSALYYYLTDSQLSPAEVGNVALSSETETLIWYSRFYARACRNWMLSTLCCGGLWITGGIAAQNPYCVENKYFEQELYNNEKWHDYLMSIPVYLMTNKNSGLWGAAYFGLEQLESV